MSDLFPPTEPPRLVPLLPLRDIVVFPRMVVPLYVGRKPSIAALESVMKADKLVLLLTQRQAHTEDPALDDLHRVGTVAKVMQLLRMPDGTVKVLVEGAHRAQVRSLETVDGVLCAAIDLFQDQPDSDVERTALVRQVREVFASYVELKRRVAPDLAKAVRRAEDATSLADALLNHLPLRTDDKQQVLELTSVGQQLERLLAMLHAELEILETENRIRSRVKESMERTQRQYFLNEQMQAIQSELGEKDEFRSELDEIEEQVKATQLSEEARTKCERELKKLRLMSPMSPEATVIRNYLEWMLAVPWGTLTADKLDLDEADRILDEDHRGLRQVKERIVEHLAVQQLVEQLKGPILCFVGPPGVGKTSLARSIARATGRQFVRMSLGGVRDEAEIRGHRRTYIGALPGKILQAMKKAGSCNPVLLLDEVDKLGADFRGDPSSALLEVLDPEQNHTFNDHYLEVDYDLSKVMFVCTANTLQGIPPPLQDRLEIIRIPGYIDEEKLDIAVHHLVPKQLAATGLAKLNVRFKPSALRCILDYYTREAGVRQLEREIANCCRKLARQVVKRRTSGVAVTPHMVKKLLGVQRFRPGCMLEQDQVGVSCGLAWTQAGGELLNTEVVLVPGKGHLTTTGTLGTVMQESAQAAMSYVRSRAISLGLPSDFYQSVDVHIHVPEGATPKDGPSAGITIATALVSALTKIPVRRDIALTGELTLRGRVLPIGGLREKSYAAYRSDIRTVIIPKENEKDLAEIPASMTRKMRFIAVEHMDEVLRHVLAVEDPEIFFEQLARHELFDPRLTAAPPPSGPIQTH